ncbi:MAG: carbonate dehydratase [Gammaproteobacteria bacterium]|nr:carbonate dehydratase [Gammaproteobacteria bacterium]
MKSLPQLFENNRAWANGIKRSDPDFFARLAHQQSPRYLWIGCADSRVPANQIVGLPPGEVFVHRNIANVVVHTDLNCLSVIHYAVEVLQVEHIIVCGHYGCGGVRAALETDDHGLIDNWLRHIRDVGRFNADRLAGLDEAARLDRLCELNVTEQVTNVCNTSIVKQAWQQGRRLVVHGWIYSVGDGILHEQVPEIDSREALADACCDDAAWITGVR